MSVNSLNFEQISTVLTSIVQQATGQIVETPTDTGSFVSIAQVALRCCHGCDFQHFDPNYFFNSAVFR